MKRKYQIVFTAALALSPMGMMAQGTAIDFSNYEGSQITNSDFEDWSGSEYSNVPVGWHSFESVGGSRIFVAFAKSTAHTSRNTADLHTGTIGNSCLKLVPRDLSMALANGTISTGRMNAGAYSATDPKNHAQMDLSVTETSNGSPFYAVLTKKPIALSVWVKFTQGTYQEEHPYATVSAAITNGDYYQEPTSTNDSTMVIGYAQNNKIASNDGQWQHLYVPFRYDSPNFNQDGDEPQAIMVTFSTNADPGQGSAGDVLLVDDLELIYGQEVTIPASGYATLTNVAMANHKITIPEGITAYTIEANAKGEPIVKDTYKAGQVLPYHAAVLLKGVPGTYTFPTTLYDDAVAITLESDICMVEANELNTPTDEYKYFRLGTKDDVLGFYQATYGLKIQEKEALLRVKADAAANQYQYVLVKPETEGDINGDGIVTIADVTTLVNRLLDKYERKDLLVTDADVNGDNNVTIGDVMTLVNILLKQ